MNEHVQLGLGQNRATDSVFTIVDEDGKIVGVITVPRNVIPKILVSKGYQVLGVDSFER